MRTRSAVLVPVLAAIGALVAGCQSTPAVGTVGRVTAPPVTATTPATAPATATTPASTPTTTPPPATTPTAAPRPPATLECKLATGLTIEPGSTDSASGHRRLVLVFTNTGDTTCVLVGYPGVDGLDAGGHSIAHAQRTLSGYEGGIPAGTKPPTVTLAPGDAASAIVEALAYGATGPCTPAYAGLLVTAPDDTRSTHVAWAHNDACTGLQIHPVVPGANG